MVDLVERAVQVNVGENSQITGFFQHLAKTISDRVQHHRED